MEFSIKKCDAIIMDRGKDKSIDRIELPSGKKMDINAWGYWSMTE